MSVVQRCAIASLLASSIFSSSGRVDYTFTGKKDGTNWFVPGNWSVSGLPATQIPGPSDNATIGPNLLTAIITNNVTVSNLAILNQGALDGPGDVRVNGTFDFNSTVALQNPKISGAGSLVLVGSMNVRGSCSLARPLLNLGTVALLQSGGVGPAKLLCAPNITISDVGTITLEDLTAIDGGALLSIWSSASIEKKTGTNIAYLGEGPTIPGPNLSIAIGSLVSAKSGTLSLYAASNSFSLGEYHADSNAVVVLDSRHTLSGQITGNGVCRVVGTASNPTNAALTVTGTLELDVGGVINNADPIFRGLVVVPNGGTLVLAGGTLDYVRVSSSGAIVITGPATTTLSSTSISNSGPTSWQGRGYVLDGSVPAPSSEFVNSGQFTDYGDHVFNVYFDNEGTFIKTLADPNAPNGPGSQTSDFGRMDCYGGVIRVESGTLRIGSGHLGDRSLLATTGNAVLAFAFGDFFIEDTLAITTPSSEVRVTGAGTVTVSGTLEVSGNLRLIGGEMSGLGTLLFSSGTFFFDGGSLGVTNVVTYGGVLTTNTIQNAGQGMFGLTFSNGGIFAMSGPVPLSDTVFINEGQVNVASSLDLTGNGSSFLNNGGLYVSPLATAYLPSTTSGGTIRVDGVLFPHSLANSGSIAVAGNLFPGSLTQNFGIFLLGSNGTVTVTPFKLGGGELSGNGGAVIKGDLLNNSGSGVDPPLVNGNYTSTANGVVTIHLGGLTPVTQYDQFSVTGNATLDGTLNISLTNGFIPTLGNQFRVMTFGSRTGVFAVKNGLKLPNGMYLMPVYSSTNLTLVATNVVFIQPAIQVSRGVAPGSVQLAWPDIAGQAYQVQFSPDLVHWFVETNLLGTGLPLFLIDPTTPPAQPARFFRLR
jgi:hypothetical protein